MRTLLILGLACAGGCSSVYDLAGGTENGPQVFGGVRTWPENVSETFGGHDGCAVFIAPFEGLIDLPCSLAGDVLLLPVTLVFEIFRK